jgi:hypothetical protein
MAAVRPLVISEELRSLREGLPEHDGRILCAARRRDGRILQCSITSNDVEIEIKCKPFLFSTTM